MIASFQQKLQDELDVAQSHLPNKADWLDGRWTGFETAPRGDRRGDTEVDMETLKKVGLAISHVPMSQRARQGQCRSSGIRSCRGFLDSASTVVRTKCVTHTQVVALS